MSGRYGAHAEYQESGLDWLGRIPTSWELRRLGSYFHERRTKVSDADFSALSVTMQGIVPQLETAAKTDDGDNRKLVRVGDFVINSRSDRKGSSGVSPYDGSVSLISIVLEPANLYPPFVHHLLRSAAFQEEFYRYGKGIVADLWSTNYAAMKNIIIPVMPPEEQTQIAKFLDYETAKIDALIEKQQQLIALLKEKRQAVISHAVTKGLNPDAPMRDSGVEWLGEVPAHWKVTRVKHVAGGFMYGTSEDCNTVENGVPVLRIPNIKDRVLDYSDLKYANFSTAIEARYLLKENDILVVRTNGNPDLVGKSAIFGGDQRCMFASYLIKIRPTKIVLPEFLIVLLNAPCTREMLTLTARTSAGNYNMNCEGLGGTPLPLPPVNEQERIAEHVQQRVAEFESLEARAEQAVELLQERRTALISAAVTGKIDVRGWKAPDSKPKAEVA